MKLIFVRRALVAVTAAALLVGQAQAADWPDQSADVRTGAFVGARIKLSLGGHGDSKPHAQLAMAPTRTNISSSGFARTRIGEGAAIDLQPGSKPSLTLAGMRADTALGLTRAGQIDPKNKMGLSTGAVIGIGLVVAIGVAVLWYKDYCDRKNGELCGDSE
jgi:opacity protein-like surface antigen